MVLYPFGYHLLLYVKTSLFTIAILYLNLAILTFRIVSVVDTVFSFMCTSLGTRKKKTIR